MPLWSGSAKKGAHHHGSSLALRPEVLGGGEVNSEVFMSSGRLMILLGTRISLFLSSCMRHKRGFCQSHQFINKEMKAEAALVIHSHDAHEPGL